MRIGALWHVNNNVPYRAVDPLREMERRGHEVVWPDFRTGRQPLSRLLECEVVHIYRSWEQDVEKAVAALRQRGVGIVLDHDDDYTLIDRAAANYRAVGGFRAEQIHRAVLRLARDAHVMTTTTEPLAERYRLAGVGDVRVVPNRPGRDLERPRNRHPGIRVGWVAAGEHYIDAKHLGIAEALAGVVARHADVSVECVGVDLGLTQAYVHQEYVPFEELPRAMARWDVGIAPLVDIPFNRMRSDIKIREYAASRLAWLASPVGPYRRLGEAEGGVLVGDDQWPDALARLVSSARQRRRLAKHAWRWSKKHTVEETAPAWEAVFLAAADGGGSRGHRSH